MVVGVVGYRRIVNMVVMQRFLRVTDHSIDIGVLELSVSCDMVVMGL